MVRQNLIRFSAFSDELQKIAWTLPVAAISGGGGVLAGGALGAITARPEERLSGAGRGALAGGALGAGAGAIRGRRLGKAMERTFGKKIPFSEFVRELGEAPPWMREQAMRGFQQVAGKPSVAETALDVAVPLGGVAGGVSTHFKKRQSEES